MGKMNVLSPETGHTPVEWKVGERSEEEARAEFDRIVAGFSGYPGSAYAVTTEKDGRRVGEPLDKFDPEAEEILIHRPLIGG